MDVGAAEKETILSCTAVARPRGRIVSISHDVRGGEPRVLMRDDAGAVSIEDALHMRQFVDQLSAPCALRLGYLLGYCDALRGDAMGSSIVDSPRSG